MKQLASLLLCASMLFVSKSQAQQTEKFDAAKDVKEVRSFTIHLTPAPNNTFGFTVVKDKQAVWSQTFNPFSGTPYRGFASKKDAYTLAEWVISEQEKNSRAPIVFKSELAKQLLITTDNQPK